MAEAIKHIDELPDGWGMIGLNDQTWNGNVVATHWLCHKNMLELTDGEFFHTGYHHTECDRELTEIAQEHGRYIWAEDAKIEHENYQIGTSDEQDEYHKYAYQDESLKHDHMLYLTRKEERIGYKLGVGIPLINDMVDTLFLYSMMLMEFPPYNLYYPKSMYHPGDIAKCRNDIAKNAIEDGCTHILMMDTDQVYHDQQMVHKMLAHKKDIVGAKVHRRWPPFEPILQRGGKHVDDTEIFAGGLQDLGRARVFGTRTAGAALPSAIERLPNQDGFQYAVANYISEGGEVLEGRGVIPDVEVIPSREALLRGEDPVVRAAVGWIRDLACGESRGLTEHDSL